jgi:hypothetical protein
LIGRSHGRQNIAERGALMVWRLLNVQALVCGIIFDP